MEDGGGELGHPLCAATWGCGQDMVSSHAAWQSAGGVFQGGTLVSQEEILPCAARLVACELLACKLGRAP